MFSAFLVPFKSLVILTYCLHVFYSVIDLFLCCLMVYLLRYISPLVLDSGNTFSLYTSLKVVVFLCPFYCEFTVNDMFMTIYRYFFTQKRGYEADCVKQVAGQLHKCSVKTYK